jgi:hypothetical protein
MGKEGEGSNGEGGEDVYAPVYAKNDYQGRRRRLDDDDDSDYSSSEEASGQEGPGQGGSDVDSDDEPILSTKAPASSGPGCVGRRRGRIPVRANSTGSKVTCSAVA